MAIVLFYFFGLCGVSDGAPLTSSRKFLDQSLDLVRQEWARKSRTGSMAFIFFSRGSYNFSLLPWYQLLVVTFISLPIRPNLDAF